MPNLGLEDRRRLKIEHLELVIAKRVCDLRKREILQEITEGTEKLPERNNFTEGNGANGDAAGTGENGGNRGAICPRERARYALFSFGYTFT